MWYSGRPANRPMAARIWRPWASRLTPSVNADLDFPGNLLMFPFMTTRTKQAMSAAVKLRRRLLCANYPLPGIEG
jgi:hypothetical protein